LFQCLHDMVASLKDISSWHPILDIIYFKANFIISSWSIYFKSRLSIFCIKHYLQASTFNIFDSVDDRYFLSMFTTSLSVSIMMYNIRQLFHTQILFFISLFFSFLWHQTFKCPTFFVLMKCSTSVLLLLSLIMLPGW